MFLCRPDVDDDDDDDVFIKHPGLPYGYAMRLQNKSSDRYRLECLEYLKEMQALSGGSNLRLIFPSCIQFSRSINRLF